MNMRPEQNPTLISPDLLPRYELERITAIVDRARSFTSRLDTTFTAWYGSDMPSDDFKVFEEALKGRTLIDAGSGYVNSDSVVPKFGFNCGASEVIAVEPSGYAHQEPSRIRVVERKDIGGKFFMFVDADMLDFLARQSAKSANITINGITEDIIPSNHPETQAYLEELVRQIVRVLPSQGIVFGSYSDPVRQLLKRDLSLERVKEVELIDQVVPTFSRVPDPETSSYFVYRKIK